MSKDDSRNPHLSAGKNVSRRDVLRIALAAGAPLVLLPLAGCSKSGVVLGDLISPELMRDAAESGPGPLLVPVVNAVSTELCANSRLSYHGGWNSAFSDQWLSNILWAAGKAPATSGPVTIYVATKNNVYVYDPVLHALNLHLAGNHRGDTNAAFQLGFAGDSAFDAGVAQHLAQEASIALWTGTASQVGSCPRESDTSYANSNWNPAATIQTAISFGTRNVAGLNATLEAVSSDGSLPNPSTDGLVYFDDAMAALKYGDTFSADPLTLQQQSQLLWGAYGCSAHMTSNGRGGLTVASAVANYYLTKDVYILSQSGVHRYHNRLPPGDNLTTRDHRLELLSSTDIRQSLQQSISGLPSAPIYIVLCLESSLSTLRWGLLEVGYAAASMLVQATSMALRSHFKTDFSGGEITSIRNITGIPTSDLYIVQLFLTIPQRRHFHIQYKDKRDEMFSSQ